MFNHISKHLEVRQKYSATRRTFNSLLGVLKCGQTRSFVFDILQGFIMTRYVESQKRKPARVLVFQKTTKG